jgi:hypothetical protein
VDELGLRILKMNKMRKLETSPVTGIAEHMLTLTMMRATRRPMRPKPLMPQGTAAMVGPTERPARAWVEPRRGVNEDPSWKPEAEAAMAKRRVTLNICKQPQNFQSTFFAGISGKRAPKILKLSSTNDKF